MTKVSHTISSGSLIQGQCAAPFARVFEAFAANFEDGHEVGASICVIRKGAVVVDLWGGRKSKDSDHPWTEQTLAVIFSATKGAVALCAHLLASRGRLELEAPVSTYWPEFAQGGKEQITVSMLLNHSAGVPAVREKVKRDGLYDWDYMCDLIARETPFWEPGTRSGYHGLTFGWLVGEIVRRVSGQSLGDFFRSEIAAPLGLDFWIGLPEREEPRVALAIPNRPRARDPQSDFLKAVLTEPQSPASLFSLNTGAANPHTRAFRAAELGSMGGVTNARGLAGLYAPLANGGEWRGVTLFDDKAIARMAAVSMESDRDETLLMPMRFALGFVKAIDNRTLQADPPTESLIMSEAAFGHPGRGGSIGFADPERGFSFGYVMNNLGQGVLVNERGQRLIDAAYACVYAKSAKKPALGYPP